MLQRGLDARCFQLGLAPAVYHAHLEGEKYCGKKGGGVGQNDADFACGGVAVEGVDIERAGYAEV